MPLTFCTSKKDIAVKIWARTSQVLFFCFLKYVTTEYVANFLCVKYVAKSVM